MNIFYTQMGYLIKYSFLVYLNNAFYILDITVFKF